MSPMFPDFATLLAQGRQPDHPVALTTAGTISWRTFRARIADISRTLPRGRQRILLTQKDPLDFAAHLLAAVSLEHTPVLPPNFQPGTLSELALHLDAAPLPPAPAVELFTSGSSGKPKRIVKRLAQLEAECRVLETLWGANLGSAAVLATVPHHHIYGLLFRVYWPLLAGRPFDALTAGEPATLHERLAASPAAILVSSPAQLARLPELHDLKDFAHRPQHIFSSGGPLPASVAKIFADEWELAPFEVFGSTESGGIAWRQQLAGNTAWTPLPEVGITADDDGALLVQSPFLDDAGRLRMEDGISLLADGRFILCGRLDRIVKIEEKRLSLPDLEARLAAHPWVSAVSSALVTTNNGRRTIVGALIVPSASGRAAIEENRRQATESLRAHLAQHFDHVLLPRRWRFVNALPYNERGKLPRDAVLAQLSASCTEELSA